MAEIADCRKARGGFFCRVSGLRGRPGATLRVRCGKIAIALPPMAATAGLRNWYLTNLHKNPDHGQDDCQVDAGQVVLIREILPWPITTRPKASWKVAARSRSAFASRLQSGHDGGLDLVGGSGQAFGDPGWQRGIGAVDDFRQLCPQLRQPRRVSALQVGDQRKGAAADRRHDNRGDDGGRRDPAGPTGEQPGQQRREVVDQRMDQHAGEQGGHEPEMDGAKKDRRGDHVAGGVDRGGFHGLLRGHEMNGRWRNVLCCH